MKGCTGVTCRVTPFASKVVEAAIQQRAAVRLAHRIGVVLRTQRQGQLQALVDAPLILRIQAQTPQGHRLGGTRGIAFTDLVARSRRRSQPGVDDRYIGVVQHAEGVVGDVVAAEVHAELQVVHALRPGEVIHKLILGDVAALREVVYALRPRSVRLKPNRFTAIGEQVGLFWVKMAR